MGRVKGTILVDFVKTIRADKTGAYDQFLTDEDKKIIAERVLPSGWYPFETFQNCFSAVVAGLAKGDMNKVKQWGRVYGETIITSVYKGIIKEGAPMESLTKYSSYVRNLFDFGEIKVEAVSDTQALITIAELDVAFEPLYHIMAGWMERSLELCGAREIKSETVSKGWDGGGKTQFRISWKM